MSMELEQRLARYLKEGVISPDLESELNVPANRREICRLIATKDVRRYRQLLIRMFDEEIAFRNALWEGEVEDSDECFEEYLNCSFLLSRCADPSDTIVLWKMHELNQDIGELDVGNFVGAGIEETLAFLDSAADSQSRSVAEYIRRSLSHPQAREWIDSWEAARRTYFE